MIKALRDGSVYNREFLEATLEAFPNGASLYITYKKSKILKITKRRSDYLCKKYDNNFAQLDDIEYIADIKLILDKINNITETHDINEIRYKNDISSLLKAAR